MATESPLAPESPPEGPWPTQRTRHLGSQEKAVKVKARRSKKTSQDDFGYLKMAAKVAQGSQAWLNRSPDMLSRNPKTAKTGRVVSEGSP